jgi:hypothetical protein
MPLTVRKVDLQRSALALLLVGPLILVVWYFGGSGPARPIAGSQWSRYEAQVRAAVQTAGGAIAESGCTMAGNLNAGLNCPVVSVRPETLHSTFIAQGWRPLSSDPTVLVADGARLSVDSSADSSRIYVHVRLHHP